MPEATTTQEKLAETLAKSGIPYKQIKCYGSQITVTAWSREAADKWAGLLANFAKVRGIVESRDYDKANQNTMLRPSTHRVFLIGARV